VQLWTSNEIERAALIFRAESKDKSKRAVCAIIADALRRTEKSVQARLAAYGTSFDEPRKHWVSERKPRPGAGPTAHYVFAKGRPEQTRPSVLAELERFKGSQPVSITAALMGDPLPGRSALDRKKEPPAVQLSPLSATITPRHHELERRRGGQPS
jgi:hypothetical protein